MKLRFSMYFAVLAFAASPARADVKLHPLFTDHMVLQRAPSIPVWGAADPGRRAAKDGEGYRMARVRSEEREGLFGRRLFFRPRSAEGAEYPRRPDSHIVGRHAGSGMDEQGFARCRARPQALSRAVGPC